MSFYRYVAICRPQHYSLIMNHCACTLLVCVMWLCGLACAISEATVTLQLPLCGINTLDHLLFFLYKLASYISIGCAILRVKSSEGRTKAFGTCSSHLIVVSLFYGPGISKYLQPPSSISRDQPKFMALFYGVVTPTLNPFTYTLRNKDVKGALGNLPRRILCSR
ncbi:Olfactory receptor 2B11 [Lemmus lemmus]